LEEVEITVLNEGRSGILGLGSEDARISVRLLESENKTDKESTEVARSILEKLLSLMDIDATIKIASAESGPAGKKDETVVFNIVGEDLGSLIGRRGQTIDAIQYLVRLMASKQSKSKIPIMIDVQDYKQRHYDDLRTLALNVASQVKDKKTSCRLETMTAYERRIIHMTLADDPDVTTESIGEGDFRKVVVLPKSRK